ncbi:MAG: ATP-binding protein, partial [Acidobacteriota bacterium]
LSAEERSFRIEYTALSFRAPDRLRFRHILEGYDEDWQDDDDRRVASYTKVPPGHYVFRVTARSSEGVWSPEGAELAIEVQPFVHETRWFRTLVGLATLALIGGAFLARDRRSRARRWQLEQAVADRTRELWREKETVAQQAEQLAELDRMKSDLFANITHEFRTPLTLILGPLTDLGAGRYGPLDDRGQQQAEVAYANAARLLVLIDQLLDISKLEAGRLLVRAGQHDIRTCVDLMVKHFRALADRRGIELEVRSPPHPIPVLFDFEHLEKILSNLLANAFKFTPRGGRVELAVTPGTGERQGWVAVVVRDTGIGLEPAEQQRIFERFYQVESTSQRRFGGTGLGLALVQELVALHRGEIALESHPGEGSTFRVWLRLGFAHLGEDQITDEEEYTLDSQGHFAVAAALAEPTSAHATVQHDLRELRSASLPGTLAEDERPAILVVDDHPELRGYVREHLEPHYRVIEAGDGREGLHRARQAPPDLVVSDVMMPEMDGFELCRQLRQDPELDWLPMILLTAKATAEARLEGLGFGADDYLTKPFDVRELLVRIDNLIASRQRLRDRFR